MLRATPSFTQCSTRSGNCTGVTVAKRRMRRMILFASTIKARRKLGLRVRAHQSRSVCKSRPNSAISMT